MRVLLDENLPHELRAQLPGLDVFTVKYMGWDGIKNGELLARAAADGFDAFITLDKGIEYEQNLTTLPLAVVVIEAKSTRVPDLLPFVPKVLSALQQLQPRTLVRVD